MKCPRCTSRTALETRVAKGVEFHGCSTCRGLLLEKRAIVSVLKTASERPRPAGNYFDGLVRSSEFVRKNKASMACPRCRYDMYETDNRGVRLDFCMNCQAIWFDAGELQLVLQRSRKGESFSLVPLPLSEVDHASGLILQILRDEWL